MLHQLVAQLKVSSLKPILNRLIAWSVPGENSHVREFLEAKYQNYEVLKTELLIESLSLAEDVRWAGLMGPISDSQIDSICCNEPAKASKARSRRLRCRPTGPRKTHMNPR
jgi:hypothetical protein